MGGGDCGPGVQSSGEEEAGSPGTEKEDTKGEEEPEGTMWGIMEEKKNIWRFWLRKHACLSSPETTNHEVWGAQVRGNPGSLEQQRIKWKRVIPGWVGGWMDGWTEGHIDRQTDR